MDWQITKLKFRQMFYSLLFLLLNSLLATGQEKTIKIYPTAGITWRIGLMNFFDFQGVSPTDPTRSNLYADERNVQGFGFNTGLQVQVRSFGLEYYPSFRYDVIHSDFHKEDEYTKGFLIDHNINVFVRKKLTYGVGMSIVNDNEVYSFVNPTLRYQSIEFKTYNVFVTVPIKKILNLEIKALYVPKGFPTNPKEDVIMYSLRAYYKFNFLTRKKNSE